MRDVFLHLTVVEEQCVIRAATGKPLKWVQPDFSAYPDFGSIEKYALEVQAQTEAYLAQLSSEKSDQQIEIHWSQVPSTKITVEAWLVAIVMEDLVHYGELSAAFWQMGLEAPYWGYWRYKVQHPEQGGNLPVADLIGYNHLLRSLYLDACAKLPWVEVAANRGLSFDSMRDVFLHLTLVEDRWISYVIPGHFEDWVDPDFNAFRDMDALKGYMQRVHANTKSYLVRLSADELNRQLVVPWSDKPDTRIAVETGLTHMVVEDMIHYGELSAALWQIGLEAPYWGFGRYYLR